MRGRGRPAFGFEDRLDELATDLVRLKVNVIVTSATPPTMAAKRATSVIPIVFVASGDPVGLASSRAWRGRVAT